MPKKKRRASRKPKQHTKRSPLYKINIFLSILLVAVIVALGSYLLISGKDEAKTQVKIAKKESKKDIYKPTRSSLLDEYFGEDVLFEEHTDELSKAYEEINGITDVKKSELESVHKYLKEKAEENDTVSTVIKQIRKEIEQVKKEKPKQVKSIYVDKRPKLAIIIDDVTFQSQVNKLNSVGYKINMSFLPPTKKHMNSAKIAQNIENYMIHLPLQASSSRFEEENTLHIGDSIETIEQRILKLKELYPKATFINNHTGSRYTADDDSMDKLLKILKKHDLKFIDSRTTSKTVAKRYAKKHGVPFRSRNIFLDNKQEFNYIQGQLKKAIRIAKKNGSSIAIGHPHKMTIRVLKESKELLKDLNIVYVDELKTGNI